jgi:hypothetical protein
MPHTFTVVHVLLGYPLLNISMDDDTMHVWACNKCLRHLRYPILITKVLACPRGVVAQGCLTRLLPPCAV